jgi:hypothetical protein
METICIRIMPKSELIGFIAGISVVAVAIAVVVFSVIATGNFK